MSKQGPIVFPTDFSEQSLHALPWAQRLAAVLDTELHVVYTVEEPHIYATLDMPALPVHSIEELERGANTRMNTFLSDHFSGGAKAVGHVLVGNPAEEIVAFANSNDAAMIVITTHGYSGVKHMMLGSTTEAVLRKADCPVVSIRATS